MVPSYENKHLEPKNPSISPAQAVALLRGFCMDYAGLLQSSAHVATSGVVRGAANQAADELLAYLKYTQDRKKSHEAETDRFPGTLGIDE